MAGFSFGAPTTSAPSFSLGGNTSTGGFNFGATPATTSAATNLQFNSPASTSGGTVSFGANANQASSGFSFGAAPTTQPAAQFKPGGFSTTNTQQPTGLTFGSTPATTQPTISFGSTPATSQTLSFGSTPAATSQPLNFSGAAQPTLSFSNNTAATQAGLTFGSTPATTQNTLNFGLSTPASSAGTGFSLGAVATQGTGLAAKPTLTFGSATTTAASTASTPSLLNFSAPKTTASTGFSLSVSSGLGTGTRSLFTGSTTTAPTTSAPAIFKGLGGVDTTTTQGSGQKDAKSVKENIVNQEIMQTFDVFKNFVKQQKNLSCEVSRAPVKPMHKVTEDTEALKQLLTSVSSALQKNRVIANKLKADTTKCLSLCEMAQRTHDTPPGLQNDNVAPLEFFIQLVSKFERDIQVLRQEIDNTEKHVNSLSYPAILTPQELSVALRRLHDSFVALAGRLQTAHAGVIAQKERHLSLRRHFLKDHTNIFEHSSRNASAVKKPQHASILPMTGPTPFSSIGGIHNMSFINQDKPVTFSSGNSALSGWGTSAISSLNPSSTSNFLQSPGSSLLSSPQPVDNQSFQLGKPPPGNKRGKR
ncbi:nuclear pore complex protein Nup58-like [Macrosteles quadrilineatus]|uniref:nuclear pore complex protein Nup58-like n=1 Tax=Macrosteles quadrilineatus TaxID=74068 RepID=UPI0023E350B2|nr:nuclear pore complex protein Nup58-like [Macrosteles quadrilineatus]